MNFSSSSKAMSFLSLQVTILLIVVTFIIPVARGQNLILSPSSFSLQERIDYKKGMSCFKNKEYKKSMNIFYILFTIHPENEEINFYLGRSAFEAGEYETALAAFDRILIKSPENQRVKLEMARTYIKLGTMGEASRLFDDVLASNPPARVKTNIKKYLDFIKETEKKHFFNAYFTAGVARDDNIYVAPSQGRIAIPAWRDLVVKVDNSKLDTWFPFGIGLVHRYQKPDSPWFWKDFLQTYHTRYCNHHDLEADYFGLTTGGGYNFNNKSQLEILPEAYYMNLDNSRYTSAFGLTTRFNFMANSSTRTSVTGLIRKKDFYQNHDRDSLETSLTISHMFKLGKVWIVPKITGKNELASNDQYSYKRLGAGITLSRTIFEKFIVSLGYTFEYEKYKTEANLFNKKRTDRTQYITAGISRSFNLGKGWNLTTGLSHTWESANSNIALYEYTRNITQLYIRLSF